MSSPVPSCCRSWFTTIGKKLVVAVTGLILVGFLAGHLAGNLLVYVGRDAMNDYAVWLHHMLHGAGVWIARVVLLVAFVGHIVATIQLRRENRQARPSRYACDNTVQASRSSRIMIWSGLTVLAFVIFHLLHYTVRIDSGIRELPLDIDPETGKERFDVYQMIIVGFSNYLVSFFYIVAIGLLCSHISHGLASVFQTLGLRTRTNAKAIQIFSRAYAIIIAVGFISIPVMVMLGKLR